MEYLLSSLLRIDKLKANGEGLDAPHDPHAEVESASKVS